MTVSYLNLFKFLIKEEEEKNNNNQNFYVLYCLSCKYYESTPKKKRKKSDFHCRHVIKSTITNTPCANLHYYCIRRHLQDIFGLL